MTKEKFKAFVKDHKREIAIGAMVVAGTVCTVVGVKGIKVCRNKTKAYKEAVEGLNQFNNALCEAMSECNYYVPVTYDEVCRAAANGHLGENRWLDPDGSIVEVKKVYRVR
jgi:hypothetical protein